MVFPVVTSVQPPPYCLIRKMADAALKGKSRKIESSGKNSDFTAIKKPRRRMRRRG
jgi:hypothetical protein